MDNRITLYKKIEQLRGNPLIVYATSIRQNVNAQMSTDAISEIIRQIDLIDKNKKEIDFMIISNGGDPICSLRIMNILRERFKKVNVLIPYVAYSAATILALGADEIVMCPYSNLGPIDPQMLESKVLPNGQMIPMEYSTEDLKSYFNFIREDVCLKDSQALTNAFNLLSNQISPLAIGASKRSTRLAVSLSKKLLSYHMKDEKKVCSIAKSLMSSFYHHAYAVGRKEARDIGLNIVYPDEKTERAMWNVWLSFENEMKVNVPFIPRNEVSNNADFLNFLKDTSASKVNIKENIFIGVIESCRAISNNEETIEYTCSKMSNGYASISPNRHINGWKFHLLNQ